MPPDALSAFANMMPNLMAHFRQQNEPSFRGPAPLPLIPLAFAVTPLYGCAVARRNRRFDQGEGVRRLPIPVISVGNITAGGTGKTPMVAWVAEQLRAQGRRPVIAMRGYGAGRGAKSDEQIEHESRSPAIPVIANPDRFSALQSFLAANPDFDCVILDDGFQHRRLARDLDLVLIDATRPPFGDRLLPAGWLREPVASLRRADAIIVTRADVRDDERIGMIWRETVEAHGRPPIASFRHEWSGLIVHERAGAAGAAESEERIEPGQWLAQKRVVAACSIGNPQSFLDMLGMTGATIIGSIVRRDHAPYRRSTIRRLQRLSAGADAIVTTEKDWARLKPALQQSAAVNVLCIPIVRPRLELAAMNGEDRLRALIAQTVEQGARAHGRKVTNVA